MNIIETRNDNVITLQIEGRIDTNTSAVFQNDILKSFQKVNNLILDFEKCVYASSAGLRALLIGQKTADSKKGTMKLINVPDVLMSVLEMTGFVNILNIE